MASGKQIAAENITKFEAWCEERNAAGDWSDYIRRGQLNRTEIANECGFAKSALRQNPVLKAALEHQEDTLRSEGTLTLETGKNAAEGNSGTPESAIDNRIVAINEKTEKRVKAFEEQNAALKAEVMELREKLKRYELIEKHLTETGRMVRP
ncbi:VPA1267 family protein [Marinobacter sp. 2_MG-2023]|uniref:VPA1267 family protein n=1 Tax=Marinobacter sp. 2_MG-2023 TaxID=3062679 RepID=UPI0026E1877C|nr:VPA1267 family protein [Marinobacter sp. 2_MG-2023]MDO6442088.1 VPA1267 family protein [Marinobacter sp. 2_MG-2023]